MLSLLIADAFHPLAVSQWLIPDPRARREVFPAYFAIITSRALTVGTVLTTADRAGAALWLPAGPGAPPPPQDYEERLAAATGPWLPRFRELGAAFTRHHPGDVPHAHLAILAVQPARHGTGLGSALLEAGHEASDTAGLPAYLEASDLRTRDLYRWHGYADHGPVLRLPDGGPVMFPMWRSPRPVRCDG